MKRGIWLGGCGVVLGSVVGCGGQAITISDSGGATSTSPGAGGVTGRGGASTDPSAGGSASTHPSVGGGPGNAGSTAQGGGIGNPTMPDPGSGSCKDFTPCGGDLVGEWRFDDICTMPGLPTDSSYCPGDQVTARISGSLIFNPNGTLQPVTTATNHHVVPASCLPNLGGCGAPSGILAGCQLAAGGSCVCDTTQQSTPPNETFVSAGNYFLLSEAGMSGPITIYYCRTGEQLIMRAVDAGRVFVYQLTRDESIPPPK